MKCRLWNISSEVAGCAIILAAMILPVCAVMGDDAVKGGWTAFRGAGNLAVSPDTNTAVTWDVNGGKGILWKADLPLPGSGSAIVSGNNVMVCSAAGNQGAIFCYDAKSGNLLWKGTVPLKGKPEVFEEETTTFAPATPVTDGKRVFAIFATGTVAAFNMDGSTAWIADLGLPEINYGYVSSPVLYNNLLLVQHDQSDEKAALVAFDAQTGKEAWRTKRSMGASWCSPGIVETAKGPQIILVSCGGVAAYDPKDGHEIWAVKNECNDIVPSPAFIKGLVIATNGKCTLAIRPDGAGDVTKTHVAWRNDEAGSDVASPVASGDCVFVAATAVLCLNATDGKKVGEREVEGQIYASPVVAGGKLYLINRDGAAVILKADKTLEVLGKASFGEPVDATPAVSGGCLYVRTLKKLICIAPAGDVAAPKP
ncbi:MAG: hypothetical protein A2X45_17055 [Lentisphaerae bacterium GWF2_50_93]|nr:MAG: hypothetical protein A2X45_17055 [Lentisphaerae bacterium GWF2_50_93]